MTTLRDKYISSKEAAQILRIHPASMQNLLQAGRLPGEKIANRWIVLHRIVDAFATTYEGRPGRPRKRQRGAGK